MASTLDRNFFTQIGLDSASLTMLGVIVHSFGEPGEYRGVVTGKGQDSATFSVSVDPSSAVASVNIDLAALAGTAPASSQGGDSDCCCGKQDQSPGGAGPRYVVHPKGHAVFRVSGGAGGYAVNLRKAVDDRDVRAYDSRMLQSGDIFSAVILRPGRYSVRNELGDARAEVTVSYPGTGETAYKPPPPEVVQLGRKMEPSRIVLKPMQGLNFHIDTEARVVIELEEPDDGPRGQEAAGA